MTVTSRVLMPTMSLLQKQTEAEEEEEVIQRDLYSVCPA